MDITAVNKNSIKIRGKHVSFIINPPIDGAKINADAVICLSDNLPVETSRVEGYRVVIKGVGEYQVSGVMVTGIKAEKDYLYRMTVDNIQLLVAKASGMFKSKEDIDSSEILLLDANSELDASVITNMEPRVVILYGEKKEEAAKILGKSEMKKMEKITISKEKLPEVMDVVVLEN